MSAAAALLVVSAPLSGSPSQPAVPPVAAGVVCLPDGTCTHEHAVGVEYAAAAASQADRMDAQLVCSSDAETRKVQVVYAHTAGNGRLSQVAGELQSASATIQGVYDRSAAAHGSQTAVLPRFVVTPSSGCEVDIAAAEISQSAVEDFFVMRRELLDQGFDRKDRKYLVYVDATEYCGMATFRTDDDPEPADNRNDSSPVPAFARVDSHCWSWAGTHELSHMLGAVQPEALHGTSGAHCTDGYDVMCYDDGTAAGAGYSADVCPDERFELRLDCNGDDYFDPNDPASGPLAGRWNIVRSSWLFAAPVGSTDPSGGTHADTSGETADGGGTSGGGGTTSGGSAGDGGSSAATRFTDVPADHLFVDNVEALAAAGVTKGCNPPDSTRFCPDAPVTRGQMAAFLVRALDLPSSDPNRFVDDDGSIFEVNIQALAAAGVTKGCNPPDNTRFCPDAPVTRGQMAAFLTRALGLPSSDRTFADTGGHLFEDSIGALAAAGVTKGCNPPDNTRFCPDAPVTRGQMAAFLDRALDL